MSNKINTTSIGLFIVTGVALGVGGLLLFSSFRLFSPTRDIIVYFNESLNGLNEGAPVKYRGVPIGSVKRVMVQFNQATNDYAMPVIIELEEKLLKERMPTAAASVFTDRSLAERVQEGLRATLQTESLVTGVLYVGVDVNPNASPPVFHQLKKLYPELPTEPTKTQQLFNNLASLDMKSLQTNLDGLITRLDHAVGQLNLAEITQGITNGLVDVRTALDQYRLLAEKLNGRIDPLADSITNSLAEANRALSQIQGAGENLRALLAPDAPIPNEVDTALHQLAGTAQSISVLVDFLNQHPNALIAGRKPSKTQP